MSRWRQITGGLRTLLHREAVDGDIADEVAHFLDEEVLELVDRGVPPDEARRCVRLKYGHPDTVREEVRAYGWENTVDALARDVRLAVRRLRRSPGFTGVAVVTLGLGIGAATAIFSAVDPILFERLAYPGAERIVRIEDGGADGVGIRVTFGTFVEVRARSRVFESLAVARVWRPTLAGDHEPERLEGRLVSAGYLSVLGVRPLLGPGFDVAADVPGGPEEVILGHGLWTRRFGGDAGIIGRSILLDEVPYAVRGVMPPGFEDPGGGGEVWSLLRYDASLPGFQGREWGHHLDMVGRLGAGVDRDRARTALGAIAASPLPDLPRPAWAALDGGLRVRGLREAVTAPLRPATLALAGAVILLLGIACVNVINLLLARGASRRGELAMLVALGAGRVRVARQLLTEGLVLAGLGGVLGIILARLGVDALAAVAPPGIAPAGLDAGAFALSLALTTLVGLLAGLAPALDRCGKGASRHSPRASRGPAGARRALVVIEVALALVLLVGAGLLFRSVKGLFSIPPGFETSNALVMQVQFGRRLAERADVQRFFRDAVERVRDVPGVRSASMTSQLPLSGDGDVYGLTLEGAAPSEVDRPVFPYAVTPGHLRTMRIPMLRGRPLEPTDVAGPPVAVISESLARSRFGKDDPIGRRLHVGRTDLPAFTVVGVVGDVTQPSLGTPFSEGIYVPLEQWYLTERAFWLVVRTRDDPLALAGSVKDAVWSVDGDQPIVRVGTLEGLVARSEAGRRFALHVLRTFAVLALVLAGVGLYGVLAGSVTDRTREIGLRAALGAPRGRIIGLVLSQSATLTVTGIAIGLAGAALASGMLASLLFGVSRLDPLTYAGVVGIVAVVGALASWLPADRATRVDPARTLRTD